jgi:hypothetical protein
MIRLSQLFAKSHRIWSTITANGHTRPSGRPRRTAALALETLEDRLTPSGTSPLSLLVPTAGGTSAALVSTVTTTNADPNSPTISSVIATGPNLLQVSWQPPASLTVASYTVNISGPGFGDFFESAVTVDSNTQSGSRLFYAKHALAKIRAIALGCGAPCCVASMRLSTSKGRDWINADCVGFDA